MRKSGKDLIDAEKVKTPNYFSKLATSNPNAAFLKKSVTN